MVIFHFKVTGWTKRLWADYLYQLWITSVEWQKSWWEHLFDNIIVVSCKVQCTRQFRTWSSRWIIVWAWWELWVCRAMILSVANLLWISHCTFCVMLLIPWKVESVCLKCPEERGDSDSAYRVIDAGFGQSKSKAPRWVSNNTVTVNISIAITNRKRVS